MMGDAKQATEATGAAERGSSRGPWEGDLDLDPDPDRPGAGDRGGPGGVVAAAGVRAGEAWLLREVGRALAALEADPTALTRPVRVVVPSHSLRLHVAERVAATRGRAAVGLRIQTLTGLALEIVERSGARADPSALFPILVRREARREPALAAGLDALVDGYGPVVGTIDDLLDAGFEPALADALIEHLEAQPASRGTAVRSRAIVRVAGRVAARLADEGVGHRARLLVRARERLEDDPSPPPEPALLLYGFSDATGVQADLVAALLRRGARLLLDRPPDLLASDGSPAGPRYGAAFRDRLLLVNGPFAELGASPPHAGDAVRVVRARTRAAEARAVASRLRSLLDAGAIPERIAVVARDLGPYRLVLRQQLTRLCVPFSGVDEPGAATAARRRLDALLALVLEEPARTEPWLAARADLGEAARADLRQACHRRGALRLEEVAAFARAAADGGGLRLDAGRRLATSESGHPTLVRRELAGEQRVAVGRAAQAALGRLAACPQHATLGAYADWLVALVRDDLGWHDATPGHTALREALDALPREPEVDRSELGWLLQRALDGAGKTPLGGAGGGVQVLSAMEARSRSFDHLFVLGMNRGVFPRTIVEDPLLPDGIRARLRELLPDLPVKRDGFDEERFLFAQLLQASPQVTFSFSETNAEGRPQPASPLLESLARTPRALAHEVAPSLHARPEPGAPALPGSERALLAGLHGDRRGFARAFAAAAREAGLGAGAGLAPDAVAAARLAILDEIEPSDGRRSLLGPYFGFVGPVRSAADPRRAPLFVTRLEHVARCPWQAFLSRLLRLSPPPDAAHELPRADEPRLLGNVVHAVLERIARRPPVEGGDPLAREAQPAQWPDDAILDAWLEAAAASEVREDANALPGYARVLARRARPFLLRARACDWSAGPPPVLGTEVEIEASVRDASGAERTVSFRADRVDRRAGRVVLTDYKTGKPFASQKKPAARAEALRREIARGRALQAVLYARGAGADAVGRYLFLAEEVDEQARSLEVTDDASFAAPFDDAVAVLLEAFDRGSFLPRLRHADRDLEPGACRSCEVKDACLRGDSGARQRLDRWLEHEPPRAPAERAAAAVFGIDGEQA